MVPTTMMEISVMQASL